MRMQREYFEKNIMKNSTTLLFSWICIWDIIPAYDRVRSQLRKIIQGSNQEEVEQLILMNSGLHNTSIFCTRARKKD